LGASWIFGWLAWENTSVELSWGLIVEFHESSFCLVKERKTRFCLAEEASADVKQEKRFPKLNRQSRYGFAACNRETSTPSPLHLFEPPWGFTRNN